MNTTDSIDPPTICQCLFPWYPSLTLRPVCSCCSPPTNYPVLSVFLFDYARQASTPSFSTAPFLSFTSHHHLLFFPTSPRRLYHSGLDRRSLQPQRLPASFPASVTLHSFSVSVASPSFELLLPVAPVETTPFTFRGMRQNKYPSFLHDSSLLVTSPKTCIPSSHLVQRAKHP